MELEKNLTAVQQAIAEAARRAGRNPEEIKLIAVSKTKPVSLIQEAIQCGILDYGENRPQELAEKSSQIPQVRWHQIGQLQRNKVKYIIDKAALIHSVDSLSLAEEINRHAAKIPKIQDILIQVNISGESSKSGISPKDAETLCRAISKLPYVRIVGLMTISVAGLDDAGNYAIFAALRDLASAIAGQKIPGVLMQELSMGMTHDFSAAIAAGATMVRIGSGIFGARDSLK